MPSTRKRTVRIEDVWDLAHVSDPRVSPDGDWLAYVVAHADRAADRSSSSVWLARLDGIGRARPFTREGHAYSPRWSPDGRALAFVANRGKGSVLYVASLEGGEPRALAAGSVSDPAWAPDGTRIAFVRSVGERYGGGETPAEKNRPRVVRDLYYRLDGVGFFDERRRHIFTVDVATGAERAVTRGDQHCQSPAWSPDSRSIAFVSDRHPRRGDRLGRADVWLAPSQGGRARRLTRGRGTAAAPVFSPDGRAVAFVGHEHGDATSGRNLHLYRVGVGARPALRCLTADADLSVAGWPQAPFGAPLAWLPKGDGLVFLADSRGSVPVWKISRSGGRPTKLFDTELQARALSVAPDGRSVAFSASWSSELPDVWLASLGRRSKPKRITSANESLRRRVRLAPTRRVRWKAADGLDIEGFLLLPPGPRRGRRLPLELEIHGGPHGAHPMSFNPLHNQAMAAAGYAVLLPNPRGSLGYGEAFARACVTDWGGADRDDLLAGVDALVERGVADPERLFVGGYSYGGYMSSLVVAATDRFRAAAVGAPVINLSSSLGTDDISGLNVDAMGGAPWERPDEYASRSPITYAAHIRTPVLLWHWEGDLRCPIGQSEELFTALKLLRRSVEFVRYPGGSHVGRSPSQDIDAFERRLAWYARHGGPSRRS